MPNRTDVTKVERKLDGMSCIGRINSWDRLYAYGQDQARGGNDPSKIAFTLREAGVYGFTDRERIVPSRDLVAIDDRQYKIASGSYDRRTGKVAITYCGMN